MIDSVDALIQRKEECYKLQLESDPRILDFFDEYISLEVVNFYDSVILNPYIPVVPFFQQIKLLMSRGRVLYGGARGGGKTEACLMGALQYAESAGWKVGIFRLTYPDLSTLGAIMDRACAHVGFIKDGNFKI